MGRAGTEKKRHWAEEAGYRDFDALLTIKAPQHGLESLGQHHPCDPYQFSLAGQGLPIARVHPMQLWSAGSVDKLEELLDAIRLWLEGKTEGRAA